MVAGPVKTRRYRMHARAASAAATGERILDAAVEAFWEQPTAELSLEGVARRAGVSVQTVIRHFGSKRGLLAAAADRETDRVRRRRDAASPGDVVEAVRVLVAHYEETGDRVLKMLAEEERVPGLREVVDRGRAMHRQWCERIFAPALGGLRRVDRDRRLAQLVAVCDVYTWKLLRRDARLSRRQTERSIRELLEPITKGAT